MNEIKVAHVTTVAVSLRYLLLNQLRSLKESGYEVTGISAPGQEVAAIEAAGIQHIPVSMNRRAFTPMADLRALWHLYRVLMREQFTIVHTHTPKAGILGRLAARLAGVPIIVHTNHGFIFHEGSSWFWRRFFVTLERVAAMRCDLVFSVNEEDVDTAILEGICGPSKLRLLGKGGIGIDVTSLNPSKFSEEEVARKRADLRIPSGAKIVGFIGRLVREKGLIELVRSAAIVRQRIPDVRFLVIGQVDMAKADALTPSVAADYGVSDTFVFTGRRDDIPELCAMMDVFVLPSHREGFPRSPMEASAMEVPCVVTDIRGCRQAVENGRNGIVVPLGDIDALANAIVELLTDKDKARRMGAEGRQMALEHFDERLVFARVRSEYSRLLMEKGFSPPASLVSRIVCSADRE